MPTFTVADGTRLAHHLRGDGETLAVLPGGPMRASAYLGGQGFPPFFPGRWDDTAREHAAAEEARTHDEAGERYVGDGASTPAATRAALAEPAAPVLVHAGEYDGGPRPALARRAAAAFPDAEVTVRPGAGHYPWLDDPRTFRDRITDCLDRTCARARPPGERTGRTGAPAGGSSRGHRPRRAPAPHRAGPGSVRRKSSPRGLLGTGSGR